MKNLYYPLHAHLAYGSIGDSILRTEDYVKRAAEYGLDALAITDHGSLAAMYSFTEECSKYGIKPIIGMEAYEAEDASIKDKEHNKRYHLVLLAKTNEGLKNLITIHNIAATDGFYTKPRTDLSILQQYGKGIICLSACMAGRIPQAILNDDPAEAIRLIQAYKECFDEFYLEIQPGHFNEQIIINDAIVELAAYTNTPIVATNDIHYLDKKDAIAHNAHVLLGRKQWSASAEPKKMTEQDLVYPDTCYWFMNKETIANTFIKTKLVTSDIIEAAINNTVKISQSCNAKLSTEIHMPKFNTDGKSEAEVLHDLCYEKLAQVVQNKPNPAEYTDRLDHELDIINQLGFNGYFLIVQDYVNWAKNSGIAIGPGRGSAAGSLVSYLLGISVADPIKYGLMFERFLDPQRAAIPDIDIDSAAEKRDLLFDYTVKKYGYDHCALVSTFHIRKAKGAIRDAARVLGYKPAIGDEIAKLIPTVVYNDEGDKTTDLDIKTSIESSPQLAKFAKEYSDIIDLAQKIEGLPSSVGIHAAGILVSPDPLTDKLPLIRPNKEGILATSLDLHDAENILVKFDYLALSYLGLIAETEKQIGFKFDYEDTNLLQDNKVWDMIGSKHTTGIFQIASSTYKARMYRLKPRSIRELAACLALVRGPCISTKLDERYMQILEGKEEVEYLCPEYNEPTKDTFGIPIYQEQVMKIFVNFGFSLSEGYKFIKDAAKKRTEKVKEKREQFMINAAQKNINSLIASKIFDVLEKSSQYSFNQSHAVSYALLTYHSAYLKVHYPLQYMASLLTYIFTRQDKESFSDVVAECRYLDIQFLPADINKSDWCFKAENGKIRIGICALKGLGEKAFKHIESLRPFTSLDDLISRVEARQFNKNAINTAILSGMLDTFIGENSQYQSRLDMLMSRYKDIGLPEELKIAGITLSTKLLTKNNSYKKLEEILYGVLFINTPENTLEIINWTQLVPNSILKFKSYFKRAVKSKSKKLHSTLELITGSGILKCLVASSTYTRYKSKLDKLQKDKLYIVTAVKSSSGDCCFLRFIEEDNQKGKI